MSWFNDQINDRILKDEEILSEAYVQMASAVVGRRLSQAWQDESYAAKTALQEICKYYHIKAREIPEKITDFNAQLDYVLQPCGIARRSVKLKKGWQADAVGAMLGTRKSDGKVIALIPGKMGGYTFTDLETGKIVKVNSKNEDQLDEEAVVFYKPFPLRSISVKDLVNYMVQTLELPDFLWFFIAMAGVTLLGMMTPKLNHILFSDVVQYSSVNLLLAVMLFMACISISMHLLSVVKGLWLSRINMKLNVAVQSASMMRVLSLPPEFFKDYTAGELNKHVQYMNELCNNLVSAVFNTGITGLFSLVYVVQIFAYAPALVVPALLVTMISLLFSIVTVVLQMKVSKTAMGITSKEEGMVYSLITGIQKIRLSGSEKRAFARWGKLYAQEAELTYNPPTILKLNSVITTAIGLAGTILMYYVAVVSRVSVADYYAFNAAYAYVSTAFASLAGIAQTIATIKPVLEIVKPLMDAQPEISQEREIVTSLSGRIELSRVSFSYEGEGGKKILDDISLRIRPGQYVAIVGKTGCGKSTLLRILMGFEKPQMGAVYYDGKDLEGLDKKSLRRKIGVVLQSGKLIRDDIFSNITISAPWLTLDDAWKAAEIAGIAEDIREMPMGMNTIIQDGSGGISGGQRQRILIARAVAPKPKILFLDEATSALDNMTQKRVSEAMDALKCTRIVIAHRLSTIKQCDRIIVLENGKIIEDGSYDKLIKNGGFFAELVARQRVDD